MKFSRAIRYPFEVLLAYVALATIPFLPRAVILRMARTMGTLGYSFSTRERKTAIANLELAFGDSLSLDERKRVAREAFVTFATVLFDLFWFSWRTDRRIEENVILDQGLLEIMDKKPSIFVTGHIGNWELMGQAVARHDPTFTAVAAPLKNQMVNILLARVRQKGAQRIVYKQGAIREALTVLKNGGRTGWLLDQNVISSDGGIYVPFFGRPVPMSPAVEKLAQKLSVAVTLVCCVPDGKGKYRGEIGATLNPSDYQGEGEMTAAIAEALEKMVSDHRENWLWMYKRWKFIPEGADKSIYPFYSVLESQYGA